MVAALSSLDLYYLVQELQHYKDALIDKSFTDGTNVFMRLYLRGQGKQFLNFGPKYLWASEKKPGQSQPHGFNEWIRRYMSRNKIIAIDKIPGERILRFTIFSKEHGENTYMMVELFGAGNIIFVNSKGIIQSCLHRQKLANRTIKPGVEFPIAEKDDLFTIESNVLAEALVSSADPASKVLASYAGRKWAHEVCLLASVKGDKAIEGQDGAQRIVDAVNELKERTLNPQVYTSGDVVKDITPFELKQYSGSHEAVKCMVDGYANLYVAPVVENPKDRKISGITTRIAMQKERQGKLFEKAEKATAQAEMIYAHYQEVSEILTVINSAREKFSWKEIKDKLKGHPIVKRIDEKNGHVYVEFSV